MKIPDRFGFYEFFAGGGMARLGLGKNWNCLMANDLSQKKCRAYQINFGGSPELINKDVAQLTAFDLPEERPMLAWASFPCQDLSLAGNREGLNAKRSGTFWPFWNLIKTLDEGGRPVPLIVLENVAGAITSHAGKDFRALLEVLNASAYQFGAVVVDAAHFVPQSRPRLFIIAVKKHPFPADLTADGPIKWWHPKALVESCNLLPKPLKSDWVWWRLPLPPNRSKSLASIIEVETREMAWHTAEETKRLLSQMSNHNLRKVRQAQAIGKRVIGTVYRRTRREQSGKNVQRAEVRFDQVSGCLRTPAGGSSRQLILVVEGDTIRSRLLAAREAARLMGVPDSYILPDNYNEAYHLMGDGLAVPVVSWLGTQLLAPLAVSIVKQGFLKAA